jgi:hypothetical protein
MHKAKHLHTKLLILLLFVSTIFTVDAQTTLKEGLTQHVFMLASDSLQGREAGTAYARMAANYIKRHFEEIGLDFFVGDSFLQPFHNDRFQNVVGVIYGNDPILRNEFIIVGAHFDHLGMKNGEIYNGADDNASGVAMLIELARKLKANESNLKRSVLLVGFDAEEIELIGSSHLAETFHSIVPNGSISLMISVDMVGWYRESGAVEYLGVGTMKNGRALILKEQFIPNGLNVVVQDFETSIFTATDTQPFAVRGIPTLAVTTGLESPYHQPEDEAHLIDFDGMVLITEHLQNVVEFVAKDAQHATSGRVARQHRPRPIVEFGVSVNIGDNYHHYTAGAVDGKEATSFGVGLVSQVNFAHNFGIRPEVHFDRIRAKFPAGTIATNNITVPLSFVFQTPDHKDIMKRMFRFDVSIGGYYAHRFSGTMDGEKMDFENTFNREEWGLTYGFGLELRPIRTRIGFINRSSFTNLMQERNADNASLRNRTSYFTMTYIF